jgi:hypothetical protein
VIPPDRMNDVLWDLDLGGFPRPTQANYRAAGPPLVFVEAQLLCGNLNEHQPLLIKLRVRNRLD